MNSSAESKFLSLIDKSNKEHDIVCSEAEVEMVFNALKPIKPSLLIGDWDGGGINTGHPAYGKLKDCRWAGKTLRSEDDVDPVMVLDNDGKRVYSEEWGHASLREMVFRGVVSTTMIYDIRPIFDHFRYVSDNVVLGAMDCPKLMGTESTFYFYLTRRATK